MRLCYLHVASQVFARPYHFNFLPASHILPSADILLKQFGPTSGLVCVRQECSSHTCMQGG